MFYFKIEGVDVFFVKILLLTSTFPNEKKLCFLKILESTMLARVLVASLAAVAAAEKVKIGDIETFHHAVGDDHDLVNHHQNRHYVGKIFITIILISLVIR